MTATWTVLTVGISVLLLGLYAAFHAGIFLLGWFIRRHAQRNPLARSIRAAAKAAHDAVQRSNNSQNKEDNKSKSSSDTTANTSTTSPLYVGIFHPYCNAGGGGERVLWCSVAALQQAHPRVHCVIYTGDVAVTGQEIVDGALQRFGVQVDAKKISFVFLRQRDWVEAARYPRFTMLGQSLGSLVLGWEALTTFVPDVYYDSMGYAFTYPLFARLARCPVACYVHYPTISTDMLSRVRSREAQVNNNTEIAQSYWRSQAKILYYRAFAKLYQFVGAYADVVMVNSTWTVNHINSIWRIPQRTSIVAPPCDTASLQKLPLAPRQPHIVSVAQFRPEKNHALQVQAFARFLKENPQYKGHARLFMVGGCRNAEDEARVRDLRALAVALGLKLGDDVDIIVNAPLERLKQLLGSCLVGLHTMRDEHFGIGVVEYMAAGTIALAHDSAGPRSDIVVDSPQRVGFRASDEASYAAALRQIFALPEAERLAIQENGRRFVADRFSEAAFARRFLERMATLLG